MDKIVKFNYLIDFFIMFNVYHLGIVFILWIYPLIFIVQLFWLKFSYFIIWVLLRLFLFMDFVQFLSVRIIIRWKILFFLNFLNWWNGIIYKFELRILLIKIYFVIVIIYLNFKHNFFIRWLSFNLVVCFFF